MRGSRWWGSCISPAEVSSTSLATESPVIGGFPGSTSVRTAPTAETPERPSTPSPRAGAVGHEHEGLAARRAARLVDGRDPGVVEARRDRGLAEETLHGDGVAVVPHELEGGEAAEALVLDEEDEAHAALPEEAVLRER